MYCLLFSWIINLMQMSYYLAVIKHVDHSYWDILKSTLTL